MKRVSARPATVGGWWREIERRFRAARLFYGHGTHDARGEAAWLVCHVLRIPFEELDASIEREVRAANAVRLEAFAERRSRTREPLAYVLREAWLQGHPFYVDRRVIVPRSHIAELLSERLAAWVAPDGPRRVLDLCTGSGCLALLAALAFPKASVDASDLSSAALAVARRNVADYRMKRRIRLVRSDLFDQLGRERYDLIVCNPPYVAARDMQRLPAEYRHEPRLALASGRDGLDLVRRLLAEAASHLSASGVLVVEIGDGRRAFDRAFPQVPVTWLPTASGDDLVFGISARDLRRAPETGNSPFAPRARR